MVKLTLIARVTDGLPLAEGLDTEKDPELDEYKHQAKVNAMAAQPHCSTWQTAMACLHIALFIATDFAISAQSSH